MIASVSRLKTYKACPRAYYLKYVEGLEPIQKASALETGSSYHELIEQMYNNNGEFDQSYTKECAMATAYRKYIYPEVGIMTTEAWMRRDIGRNTLIGRVDGLDAQGLVVEHKTTSGSIGADYEYNLLWDEQILAYMYLSGCRKIRYTVCRKPTIRQKLSESDEEFFNRMVEWYDTDTENEIRTFIVERSDEEVEQFVVEFDNTCKIIDSNPYMYRNTCHCNTWGRRCEYSSVCLNYDPNQQYVEFTKGDRSKPYGSE